MKCQTIRRALCFILTLGLVCSFSVAVFATPEMSGVYTWQNAGVQYSATVFRTESYVEEEIPIMSSAVTLRKNVPHTFGNCVYNVRHTETLWTNFVSQLDTAGANINVKSEFNRDVEFVNTVTFSSPDVSGTFCAFTTCYGYSGDYYVQRHGNTPAIVYDGDFSFAPFNCDNMILYVLDTRFI